MGKDKDLVRAILENRNQMVLNDLYESVLPKVKSYVLGNNGNHDDAKDVFQDAVISFFHAVKTKKFDVTKSVDGYLFVIAKNAWMNKVRKQKRIELNENLFKERDDSNESHLDNLISQERQNAFSRIFNQLSQGCQEILKLSIYESLPPREIMIELKHSSIDVTRTNLYRCRKKLSSLVLANKKELSIAD